MSTFFACLDRFFRIRNMELVRQGDYHQIRLALERLVIIRAAHLVGDAPLFLCRFEIGPAGSPAPPAHSRDRCCIYSSQPAAQPLLPTCIIFMSLLLYNSAYAAGGFMRRCGIPFLCVLSVAELLRSERVKSVFSSTTRPVFIDSKPASMISGHDVPAQRSPQAHADRVHSR